MTPIVVFSGPSGSGKTRLLVRLLPALRRRGLKVAALKHTGHPHSFDKRGKDSERLRRAGAEAVVVSGPTGIAYFGPPVQGVRALARLLPPADLILAEGFKSLTSEPVPRIEVHRKVISREFLCAEDRRIVAVVGDEPPPRDLPLFDPDQVDAIAEYVHLKFLPAKRGVKARGAVRGDSARAKRPKGRNTQ